MTTPEPPTPPRTPAPAQSPASTRSRRDEKTEGGSNLGHLKSWASKNSVAVAGWLIAFISMVVAIVALLPGFRGQRLSEKALELAEWTALKDYIEQCKEELLGGAGSTDCQEVVTMPLPPPPHVQTHSINHVKRFLLRRLESHSPKVIHITESSDITAAVLLLVAFLTLLLAAVFRFASFERNRKALYNQTEELTDGEAIIETCYISLAPALQQRTALEQMPIMKPPCTGSELGHFKAHIDVDPDRKSGHFIFHQSVLFSHPYKNWSLEELRLADYESGFCVSHECQFSARPEIAPLPNSPDESFRPHTESTCTTRGWDEFFLDDLEGLKNIAPELALPGFPSPGLPTPRSSITEPSSDSAYSTAVLIEASDNQGHRARKNIKKPKKNEPPAMRFACPYYKMDPRTYHTRRTCRGPGWTRLDELKEHLYRKHRLLDCDRCLERFESESELKDHYSQPAPCPLLPGFISDPIYGFKEETEKKLRMKIPFSSHKRPSNEEEWTAIYRILFELDDKADVPPPYHSTKLRLMLHTWKKPHRQRAAGEAQSTRTQMKVEAVRMSEMGVQLNETKRRLTAVTSETAATARKEEPQIRENSNSWSVDFPSLILCFQETMS